MNKLFEDVCHEGGSSSASLAVRSNLLATCGRDRCVKIWNTNIGSTDTLVKKLETTAAPECVHFSHDEHHLTYGSMSGAVKLVDVATGKEMRTLSGHRGKVFLVCQSPKSIYTWASGSLDNTVILWDIRQHPAAVVTFRQHSKAVCALQFSPDAGWLASGAEDCKVKLVDVRVGGQGLLADLIGHSGSITDVRFHPSDYLLASGSADKTVRFWDLETYECVTQSQPATSAVRKIRFSRDGGALLTATEKDVRAIHWEPFDLLGQAVLAADAVNTLDCAATDDGVRIVAALPTTLAVLDAHIELLLTLPSSSENSDGGEVSVEHDPSPFTDSLVASAIHTPSFARSGKVRRSFHAAQLPAETTSSSAAEESSSESGATTSVETSPVHGAMPFRRRNSKSRTKSLSSPSKSPARRHLDPLECTADEAFKKRDKLPRSRPQSPPPMQFDCLPSEEVFAVSVVSTGKGSGTATKTTKSRTVERQSSTGKSVERKPSLTRGSTNNARVSGGNKSTTKTVVAVEPLGRKVEKVSPLPRSGVAPIPNIPGQVDRRDSLRLEGKPLVAVTPATPTSNNTTASSCVDPTEFLPMQLSDRSLGALRLTPSPLAAATSALNERDCLAGIGKDAQTMHVVMQHRANAIHALRQTWKSGGLQRAVDVAMQTNDQTLIVELLNTLNSRSSLWSLHLCALLLPEIGKLLESKHEVYVQTAVHSLRVIVAGYGEIIRHGVARTPSIGVDVPREERYEKCKRCHSQLMGIRSLAGSNAKLGRHASAYREVGVLMQLFDAPV